MATVEIEPDSIEFLEDDTARARLMRNGVAIEFKKNARTELLELVSFGVGEVRVEATFETVFGDRVVISEVQVTPLDLDYVLPTSTKHLNVFGRDLFKSVRHGHRCAFTGTLYIYQRCEESGGDFNVSIQITGPVSETVDAGKVELAKTEAPREYGKRARAAFWQGLRPLDAWDAPSIRKEVRNVSKNLGFVCDANKLRHMGVPELARHLKPYDTCIVGNEPKVFYGVDVAHLAATFPHAKPCIYDDVLAESHMNAEELSNTPIASEDNLRRACRMNQRAMDAGSYLAEHPRAERAIRNVEGIRVVELSDGELVAFPENKTRCIHLSEEGLLLEEPPTFAINSLSEHFELADDEDVSPFAYGEATTLRVVPVIEPSRWETVKRNGENVYAVVTEDGVAVLMKETALRSTKLSSTGHLIEGGNYPCVDRLMRGR